MAGKVAKKNAIARKVTKKPSCKPEVATKKAIARKVATHMTGCTTRTENRHYQLQAHQEPRQKLRQEDLRHFCAPVTPPVTASSSSAGPKACDDIVKQRKRGPHLTDGQHEWIWAEHEKYINSPEGCVAKYSSGYADRRWFQEALQRGPFTDETGFEALRTYIRARIAK